MIKEQLINRQRDVYFGSCRSCGYDLVLSKQDQNVGPEDEIMLECEMQEETECVTGEWFKIFDMVD